MPHTGGRTRLNVALTETAATMGIRGNVIVALGLIGAHDEQERTYLGISLVLSHGKHTLRSLQKSSFVRLLLSLIIYL